jgi:phosphoribosylanthranilate isomerase
MIIKVCGMREAENIRAIEALGIDWMGFIFYPKSKRYVMRIDYLPERCERIGVFVHATIDDIVQHVQQFSLTGVQLHSDESPEFCSDLRHRLPAPLRIIKAFSIAEPSDVERTAAYEGCCDYYLFDTPGAGYGGTGQSFDWSLLRCYTGQTPFLLSGGIGAESLPQLRALHHPRWCGVDLNSRFETAPAVKDPELLRPFIHALRAEDLDAASGIADSTDHR